MYNYTTPSPAPVGEGRDAAAAPAPPAGPPTVVTSEVLEGQYLAQMKKSKALSIQLESERVSGARLRQELDAALAENAKLRSRAQGSGKAKSTARHGAEAVGGGAPPGLPLSLARKLQLGTGASAEDRPGGDKDGGSGSDSGGDDEEDDDRVQRWRRRHEQLKDRLARAHALVRERDVQLSEVRREGTQLRLVLSRELGKTPEELAAWLSSGAGGGSTGLDGPSGWKSRAEQIVLLRGKVKDLERALQAYQSGDADGRGCSPPREPTTATPPTDHTPALTGEELAALVAGGGDDLESLMALARQTCPVPPSLAGSQGVATLAGRSDAPRRGAPSVGTAGVSMGSPSTAARTDVDDAARDAIAHVASRQLKNLREVEAELAAAQAATREERRKQTALQARLSSLQRDNAQLRAHIGVVLGKSASDDELIAAYKRELEEAERMQKRLQGEVAALTDELEVDGRGSRGGEGAVAGERGRGAGGAPAGGAISSALSHHGPGTAAAVDALAEENRTLSARVRTLEAIVARHTAADGAGEGGDAARPAVSYATRVIHWALDIAGASAGSSAATSAPAISDLLRAAHAHVLLTERQLQQWEASHTIASVQGTRDPNSGPSPPAAAGPPLPQVLLRENANLKERVKSLTELLKKEARVGT